MNKTKIFLASLIVVCCAALGAFAQEGPLQKTNLSQPEIDRIIKSFTSKEAEFRDALNSYAFNRSATLQTIGLGGQITGVYRRDSFLTFLDDGRRFEKITFFPIPTLTELQVTPEDLDDLGGINPFAINPSKVPLYNINYVGKQKIDELNLYVFDVTPKVMPDAKSKIRLFSGRVWVDDVDLQIVKSKGKAVPETKESRYPIVETWRDKIDGKYWFPVYSASDDELVFNSGQVVKIKMRVKYSDYRLGRTDVRILDDDPAAEPIAAPTPAPKKP